MRNFCSPLLRHHLIPHLPQPLHLGLHHVADVEERVGALPHAAAGAADEDVAGPQAENVRGVGDLLPCDDAERSLILGPLRSLSSVRTTAPQIPIGWRISAGPTDYGGAAG